MELANDHAEHRNEGDENTKFFHKVTNGKKKKSLITKLCLQGEVVEEFDKIKDEVIRLFSLLYSREERDRPFIDNLFSVSLDEEMVHLLKGHFSVEEVKNAIFSMEHDKSPGPDGFTMLFYQD